MTNTEIPTLVVLCTTVIFLTVYMTRQNTPCNMASDVEGTDDREEVR